MFRFTVFVSSKDADYETLFEAFHGIPSVETIHRKGALYTELTANTDTNSCVLKALPHKLDFICEATYSGQGELPNQIPVLAEDKVSRQLFIQAAQAVLKLITPVRLAVSHRFVAKADSHESAYKTLQPFIPAVTLDPKSSDFNYQINRYRPYKVGAHKFMVNRISSWNGLKAEMQFVAPGKSVQHAVFWGSSLETDINTSYEFEISALNTEEQSAVLSTLVDWSFELSEKGDVP